MQPLALQKRPNDLFISYSHADVGVVQGLVDWLHDSAGLNVWFDASSGDASQRSSELLTAAIQSTRGALFVLSSNWNTSWCKDEHEVVRSERRATNDLYFVVAIRIDNSEIPPWFTVANVIDLPNLEPRSAAQLLRSLVPDAPARYDNDQDVYFAGPWSRPGPAVKPTLNCLFQLGWRLVGDSPDNPYFSDAANRIKFIIATVRGLVALQPFDPSKAPEYTSPYVLDEIRIARTVGKPYLLMHEKGVQVSPDIAEGAFLGSSHCISEQGPDASVQQALSAFDEELSMRPHDDTRAYSFLAVSLLEDREIINDLMNVLERISNMKCILGERLTGEHVQKAIVDRICRAAFVIADVTDDNRNTLIEAGVALGARTPLHLLSRPPADDSLKSRFMFQDREMHWYDDPLQRLGISYRIGRTYRRRVLNPK
jgi:hypothetical protein